MKISYQLLLVFSAAVEFVNTEYVAVTYRQKQNLRVLPIITMLFSNTNKSTEEVNHGQSSHNKVLGNPTKVAKYSYLLPTGMKSLVELEWKIIYPLVKRQYFQQRNEAKGAFTEERDGTNKDIERYLHDFERSTQDMASTLELSPDSSGAKVDEIAGNVLAGYKIVSRFLDYVQVWLRGTPSVENNLSGKITLHLRKVYNTMEGPTVEDLEAVMYAILRIHEVYSLSPEDIADGFINGRDTKIKLHARDCFRIGMHGVSLKWYATGIQWLKSSLNLIRNGSDASIKYEFVQEALQRVELVEACSFKTTRPICESLPKMTREDIAVATPDFRELRLWGVCNGRISQTQEQRSKLFCWREHEIHPSYKIGPVKAEILSMLPNVEIVQYYEIIPEGIGTSLTNVTHESAERPGSFKEDAMGRTRQVIFGWSDEVDPVAAMKIVGLVNRLSGLKTIAESPMRLSAYTPGGHRSGHFDNKLLIATFLLYFTDVVEGGETAFLNGAKAVPRKGSGVFWYNSFSCGEFDESTEHCACPVVFGAKWVGFKGIHYKYQHHLQCHEQPKKLIEILVNGKSKYVGHRLPGHLVR